MPIEEPKSRTTICLTVRSEDIVLEPRGLGTVRRLLLIPLLLISVALFSAQISRPALAQAGDTSVLYVSPGSVSSAKPDGGSTPSFSVNVNLNLSSTDTVAGYDIYMSYNNTVLNATGLHAGNLFPPDQVLNSTYCVNDFGYGCTGLDSYNVVHWSAAYLDGALSGPLLSRTVFSVQFSVLGIGHSFLQLFNDTLFGAVDSSGNSPPVVHVSWHGIYSNNGLQAFFNVAPAILLVNNAVYFDASTTFNPDNSSAAYRSSLAYSWDFGDGKGGVGVTVPHTYSSAKNYNVNLVVTDASGNTSAVSRTVIIVPALGGLKISVKDMNGNEIYRSVTFKLFIGSFLVKVLTRQAGNFDPFVVSGLAPGLYLLDFNGSGIIPASKEESVVAGVMRGVIVYLTVPTQTVSEGYDLWIYLFLGSVVAVLVVGAVSMIRERLKRHRGRTGFTRR